MLVASHRKDVLNYYYFRSGGRGEFGGGRGDNTSIVTQRSLYSTPGCVDAHFLFTVRLSTSINEPSASSQSKLGLDLDHLKQSSLPAF